MDILIVLTAVGALFLLGAALGGLLGWAAKALKVEGDPRVEKISELLPGGQCGQCGEPGCKQAAEAMVAGRLAANCCPPGGNSLAMSIASILGVSLDTDDDVVPVTAYIDETQCSGCTRCLKACPFDAIVGANRQIHTVISSVCTGCKLCEKACMQGCLSIKPVETDLNSWLWPKPNVA